MRGAAKRYEEERGDTRRGKEARGGARRYEEERGDTGKSGEIRGGRRRHEEEHPPEFQQKPLNFNTRKGHEQPPQSPNKKKATNNRPNPPNQKRPQTTTQSPKPERATNNRPNTQLERARRTNQSLCPRWEQRDVREGAGGAILRSALFVSIHRRTLLDREIPARQTTKCCQRVL